METRNKKPLDFPAKVDIQPWDVDVDYVICADR